MFEYQSGVEVESKRRDEVQLNGDGSEYAGRRIGPGDGRNLHVFLLECLIRHSGRWVWPFTVQAVAPETFRGRERTKVRSINQDS